LSLALLTLAGAADLSLAQAGREYIYIVGSSTIYPFATTVAERFGRGTPYRTPKVESTGSGGGFKLFCDGIGVNYPDVTNSSRPIKRSELEACARNGVDGIVEVKIGYDGIVIASALDAPALVLSREDLFLALAKQVPGAAEGELIPNPHRKWSDIRPVLPDHDIEVLGPPPTSGTRDVLVELALQNGCMTIDWIARLRDSDPARFRQICHTIREDGAYVEAGENDNLIVLKLQSNALAHGIFGFSFLDQNVDKIKGATVDGVAPTFDAIADGSYPVSRPLYFYVKKAHVDVIPGLRSFLNELTSERAWGDEGYLSYRGLIPMPRLERDRVAGEVRSLTPIALAHRSTD
jgi:phosphate transport system substrate-binding protein